jgi:2-haloacid dehalogenase
MAEVAAVIFDVGDVLFHWNPKVLYERLIPQDQALDAFMREVTTREWHFQHDAGRPFAETSAELIARFPEHEALIRHWGAHFIDCIGPAVDGMAGMVAALERAGVALYGLTNFSAEFWPPFRAREADFFAPFRDILVSGEERLVKPDPAIYARAIERFGIDPAATLFVDDRPENVRGAEAAGMRGHLFRDAPALVEALARCGLAIATPAP